MALRVGVVGAQGRMGSAICKAITADDRLELVATVGRNDELSLLAEVSASIVVDVTTADAARRTLPWCAANGMNTVVGTTGFTEEDHEALRSAFVAAKKTCFLVPNFSIGAVLGMKFAEQAAPYFDGVEIIELHHAQKKDAPSGTAVLTANKIHAAKGGAEWTPDPTESETVAGVRGGEAAPGVRVHSVRLPGLLAHQEVIFGSTGQTLTIKYDSYDRQAFMLGVVQAILAVDELPSGLTIGLDAIL